MRKKERKKDESGISYVHAISSALAAIPEFFVSVSASSSPSNTFIDYLSLSANVLYYWAGPFLSLSLHRGNTQKQHLENKTPLSAYSV